MKKTPEKITPKDLHPKSKLKQQEKLERAIRFSRLKKEHGDAPEIEKSGTNKERKQAYYAQKVEKEKYKKREPKITTENLSDTEAKSLRGKNKSVSENTVKIKKDSSIRLNKYLANAGITARRKADELIANGLVQVNGKVITEMGYRVQPKDVVTYKNKTIKPANYVYILLNKPKNFVTTLDDERGRKTVMDLITNATNERVYPVGRLDRNTTGLLLFTNDGDLAQLLSHPKHSAKKIYEVELDKAVSLKHMQQIANGLELEDGVAAIDDIAYSHPQKKNIVGITLHVGKNRIVRRIFEHLGYVIEKLDRTVYSGLTKKDLPRGRWRHLSPKEVVFLKHMSR